MSPARCSLLLLAFAPAACTALLGAQDPIEIYDTPPAMGDAGTEAEAEASPCTVCDGACVDEQNDDANCGGCGLQCPTGCKSGRCLVVLAQGGFDPATVAVNTTDVYWTLWIQDPCPTGPAIMSVGKNGGAVATVVSGLQPYAMAANATALYVTSQGNPCTGGGGAVLEIPLAGAMPGPPRTLATGQAPRSLALDEASVYWVDENEIGKMPLDGGSVTTLATGQNVGSNLAVNASGVYFSTPPCPAGGAQCGDILAVPTSGGTPSMLYSASPQPWTGVETAAVGADANDVYWNTSGCDGSQCASLVLKGRATGGGAIAQLASVPSLGGVVPALIGSSKIVVDSSSAYWVGPCPADAGASCDGELLKVGLDGGAVTTLATGVQSFAVDETSVYWGNSGFSSGPDEASTLTGSILKLTPK